jgi:hypothetical protein
MCPCLIESPSFLEEKFIQLTNSGMTYGKAGMTEGVMRLPRRYASRNDIFRQARRLFYNFNVRRDCFVIIIPRNDRKCFPLTLTLSLQGRGKKKGEENT